MTLLFIAAAVAGWAPAYGVVIAISAVQVIFFDRCAIALLLKKMPWNQGRAVQRT